MDLRDQQSVALPDRLGRVGGRIAAACVAAQRDPAGVRLIAVSKTHSADQVRTLYDLGQRDFGENKYQELAGKSALAKGAADRPAPLDVLLQPVFLAAARKCFDAFGSSATVYQDCSSRNTLAYVCVGSSS